MFNPELEAHRDLLSHLPLEMNGAIIYLINLTLEQLTLLYGAGIDGYIPKELIEAGFPEVVLHAMLESQNSLSPQLP